MLYVLLVCTSVYVRDWNKWYKPCLLSTSSIFHSLLLIPLFCCKIIGFVVPVTKTNLFFQDASFPRIFRIFRALGLRHLVVLNENYKVNIFTSMVFNINFVPTYSLRVDHLFLCSIYWLLFDWMQLVITQSCLLLDWTRSFIPQKNVKYR